MEFLNELLKDIGRLEIEKYLNKGYVNTEIISRYELEYIGTDWYMKMPTKNNVYISVKRLENESFKKCINIL